MIRLGSYFRLRSFLRAVIHAQEEHIVELTDAAVRSAKNSEVLRAELRRERAEVARLTKETRDG